MAIFKKTEDQERPERPGQPERPERLEAAPVPRVEPARAPRARSASVIGPTMEFKGELTADEDLVIEGLIVGTITHHNKHLTVGEKGRVKADVHANGVIVLGQLVGNIHCTGMVQLSKTSDVIGDIHCGRIVMEDGAKFKGNIEMNEKAAATAAPVAAAPQRPVPVEAAHPERVRSVARQPGKAS